jgi:hypothetical protein
VGIYAAQALQLIAVYANRLAFAPRSVRADPRANHGLYAVDVDRSTTLEIFRLAADLTSRAQEKMKKKRLCG